MTNLQISGSKGYFSTDCLFENIETEDEGGKNAQWIFLFQHWNQIKGVDIFGEAEVVFCEQYQWIRS